MVSSLTCECLCCCFHSLFFFFQAEDGIRDVAVTGVQTCALPISGGVRRIASHPPSGLKANDWIPSTVVSSPVARLRRPILLGMGFLSFFSFSSCDSEMPME